MKRRYIVPDPRRSPNEYLLSAILVEVLGNHEHVTVYNRGGLAGTLVLMPGDSAMLAALHGLAWDECDDGL